MKGIWISLDFETSGTNPEVNAPISLGLAIWDGEEMLHASNRLIGPKRHYKTGKEERVYEVGALEVSGITMADIRAAEPPKDVVEEVSKIIVDHHATWRPVVAFRSSFDNAFWSTLLFLAGDWDQRSKKFTVPQSPLLGGWFCAHDLAKCAFPNLADHKLATVAKSLGLEQPEPHDSGTDAVLAGQVWLGCRKALGVGS